MKKRVIAVILAIAVMVMAGCSSKEPAKTDNNQVSTTPEITKEEKNGR